MFSCLVLLFTDVTKMPSQKYLGTDRACFSVPLLLASMCTVRGTWTCTESSIFVVMQATDRDVGVISATADDLHFAQIEHVLPSK